MSSDLAMEEAMNEAEPEAAVAVATAWFVGEGRAKLGHVSRGNERAKHWRGERESCKGTFKFFAVGPRVTCVD